MSGYSFIATKDHADEWIQLYWPPKKHAVENGVQLYGPPRSMLVRMEYSFMGHQGACW